jgi:nucleotide-binding universal stress UspA family protein
MSNCILVPTDFSKNASNALDYAITLAKKEKAKILLLHAFHVTYITPDVPAEFMAIEIENAEKMAIKKMKSLFERIKHENLECEVFLRQDMAVDLILEVAKDRNPDFIVIGTTGASGLEEIIMGNITATVISKAKCPVIAVPEKASFKHIKHITYATDYLISDLDALKKLVEIAKLFKATITVVHVSNDLLTHENEEEFMNKFKAKVKKKIKYENIAYKLIYGQNFINTLEEYVHHESSDLIAMSTHHQSIYDKIFGKSNTKKMSYHSTIPLLAFHHKKESVIFI